MAGGYTVTIQQLNNTASELTDLNGQFQQQVGRLLERKDELQSMWEGDAKAAFNTAFARSYESLNSFYSVIARYIEALQKAAAAYARAESEATNIASTRS